MHPSTSDTPTTPLAPAAATAISGSSCQGRRSNLLVTAGAVALATIILAQVTNVPTVQTASAVSADEPLTSTPFNASEQRKQMIDQLRLMNDRLTRIENKLSQPLDVRVKEMPPIVLPGAAGGTGGAGAPLPPR